MIHTVPIILSTISIFSADIIFLETDWWLNFEFCIFYLFLNYSLAEYSGNDVVYYLNWSTVD